MGSPVHFILALVYLLRLQDDSLLLVVTTIARSGFAYVLLIIRLQDEQVPTCSLRRTLIHARGMLSLQQATFRQLTNTP